MHHVRRADVRVPHHQYPARKRDAAGRLTERAFRQTCHSHVANVASGAAAELDGFHPQVWGPEYEKEMEFFLNQKACPPGGGTLVRLDLASRGHA